MKFSQTTVAIGVLISFREWLHSYYFIDHSSYPGLLWKFSSLSESGFIPTNMLFAHVVVVGALVLISFREWLHSYSNNGGLQAAINAWFSSLSESGFIPTQ